MPQKTERLKELYLEVADGEIITEPQAEAPSTDPLDTGETDVDRAVSDAIRHEGLTDAIE